MVLQKHLKQSIGEEILTGYPLKILTMKTDMSIPQKKLLQKQGLITALRNYSEKMTSSFQPEELLENWL